MLSCGVSVGGGVQCTVLARAGAGTGEEGASEELLPPPEPTIARETLAEPTCAPSAPMAIGHHQPAAINFDDSQVRAVVREAALLKLAFDEARRAGSAVAAGGAAAAEAAADPTVARDDETWDRVGEFFGRLGELVQALSRCPPPSDETSAVAPPKQRKRVRFSSHDLSSHSPPKVHRPGSERAQEELIGSLAALVQEQQEQHVPSASSRACMEWVERALSALAEMPALDTRMAAVARFYVHEARSFVHGVPILRWRLQQLLSSSLRFHLASIFAEEEGADPDPLLQAIQTRVHEHAAEHGYELAGGENAQESFAAVVSQALQVAKVHSELLEPGSTSRAALDAAAAAPDAALLAELPSESRESLLLWAQAHAVLLDVFGPKEQLTLLRAQHSNAYHFERLAVLARLVGRLGLTDEAYFTPLRDVDAFQEELHAQVGIARAVRENLVVYGQHAKRRSSRKATA